MDLKKIAIATAGTVGADLANLVNEAALRAVRLGRKAVNQEDLLVSFELVIAGSEKKGSVLTEFEKKLVAYHEVGHAMVAYKQKNTEPVQKITIVPHTQGSLGYTLLMPEEDKTDLRTRDELLAKICVSMGGRAAEEVVLNTMTNGAAQDIQDATSVARSMVALYGMSEQFGMMALASRRNQYLEGGYGMDCADDTAADVDAAVREILTQCYTKAVQVIRDNREDMDKVVAYKQKNTEPVQKITIVPHTQGSLGYTLLMPEEDKTDLRTRDELLAKIMVSMGGRAAEEVVLNTMTNGAAQDIQDATSVARSMVVLYGMSDQFGMMALASRRNQYLDGGYGMDCAQDTAAAVDQAVKELLTQCYNQAVQVIKENREDMDKVVAYLLEKETITGAEMVAILEGRDPATADNYPDPDKKEPQQPAPAEQPEEASAQEAIPLGEGQAPVQQQEEEQPPADHPPTE